MPGKHAPSSSKSFYLSLAGTFGSALVVLAFLVGLLLIVVNFGDSEPTKAAATDSPTPAESVSPRSSAPPASVTPTPSPSAPLRVSVLNGTARNGLAKAVSAPIRSAGYTVVRVTNAPSPAAKSTIFYRSDSQAAAAEFQQMFPEFTVLALAPSAYPSDVALTVLIGADYPRAVPSRAPTSE